MTTATAHPLPRPRRLHPPGLQPARRPPHQAGHQPQGLAHPRGARPHVRRAPPHAGQPAHRRRPALPRRPAGRDPVGPQPAGRRHRHAAGRPARRGVRRRRAGRRRQAGDPAGLPGGVGVGGRPVLRRPRRPTPPTPTSPPPPPASPSSASPRADAASYRLGGRPSRRRAASGPPWPGTGPGGGDRCTGGPRSTSGWCRAGRGGWSSATSGRSAGWPCPHGARRAASRAGWPRPSRAGRPRRASGRCRRDRRRRDPLDDLGQRDPLAEHERPALAEHDDGDAGVVEPAQLAVAVQALEVLAGPVQQRRDAGERDAVRRLRGAARSGAAAAGRRRAARRRAGARGT